MNDKNKSNVNNSKSIIDTISDRRHMSGQITLLFGPSLGSDWLSYDQN